MIHGRLLGLVVALLPTEHAQWPVIEPFFSTPAAFENDFGAYPTLLTNPVHGAITTPAEWQAHRTGLRAFWMNTIGPWPAELTHPQSEIKETETTPEGITRHKIEVELQLGRRVTGYLLIPPGTGPFPAVVDFWYFPAESAGIGVSSNGSVDFSWQLAKRGFVALAIRDVYNNDRPARQDMSHLAYLASSAYHFLADRPDVDPERVGVVGHSFGGKWSLFAGALVDKFAAVAVSDPDVVFDETHVNANYWEVHYLGYDPALAMQRTEGPITPTNPRTGAYKELVEGGHDLTELEALIAPRPFFVAGGAEDKIERWRPLNRVLEVYQLLGAPHRLGLSTRALHEVSPDANAQVCAFFESFLMSDLMPTGYAYDGGWPFDAGMVEVDAGVEVEDAGVDAGLEADAGETFDAGEPDAGEPDAGSEQLIDEEPTPSRSGCGCASSTAGAFTALLSLALMFALRRRSP